MLKSPGALSTGVNVNNWSIIGIFASKIKGNSKSLVSASSKAIEA
jgi:hypothetical protein